VPRALRILGGAVERLDVTAAIRLAGGARVMRPLRLPAGRAEIHDGERDAVLGATLVAAGFRRFSLRDGHERLPTIASRCEPSAGTSSQRSVRLPVPIARNIAA